MDSDKSSFLVLVIDVHSLIFSVISKCERDAIGGVVQDICGSITYFCSSYALMHRQNCLSVICSASDGSNVVYPLLNMDDGGFVPVLHELARDLSQVIYRVAANEISQMTEPRNPTSDNGKLSLARAFSLALSTLNRHREMQSRILVLQFDRDRSRNYNSIMNSIFSAQKLGVLVDALVLANFDSHLLQQACFLTGGVYLRHADAADLLQLLLTHFTADNATRALLATPTQKSVDFKASCHCHQRPVEFAYMCSVCLTLTCQPAEERCEVCLTPARGAGTGGAAAAAAVR